MEITLISRSHRELFSVKLPMATKSVQGLQLMIEAKTGTSTSRHRISTLDKKVMDPDQTLAFYNIKDGDKLIFKDLGPQISWRTVFFIEYLGPLLIHPLFYFWVYKGLKTPLQTMACLLICIHFAKRELETLFIHRFSHATMPLSNLFKNSFHYWVLSGIAPAYFLYASDYNPSLAAPSVDSIAGLALVALFAAAEVSNGITHVILRNLRPAGTRIRRIPFGFGFDLVSCPNYFFESVAWIALSVLTGSLALWVFTIFAAGQMWVWAVKKHKAYRKEFGDKYPRRRRIMIPFLA